MLYLVVILLLVTAASVLLNLLDQKINNVTRISALLYGGAAIVVYVGYLRVLW